MTEALVIESLSTHVRCVISMYGDGIGAAARGACWRYIFGSVSVWLGPLPLLEPIDSCANADLERSTPEQLPQDEAYSQSDVHLKIKTSYGIDADTSDMDETALAKELLPDLLKVVKATLDSENELCKKKSLYVRLGCRGDWPNIEMPEWANP